MLLFRLTFVIVLSAVVFGCSKEKKSVEPKAVVLAIVGSDSITTNDLNSYAEKQKRSKSDFQKYEVRQNLLEELIQDKLIYFDAREKKLDELDEIKMDVTTRKDEFYYEKVLKNDVYFSLITEEEVMSFYEKLKTEVRVRQIFIGYKNPAKTFVIVGNEPVRSRADAKHLADSLVAVLVKMPQAFDTLVETFSDDQNSKYLKGDIGFLRWGVMPQLEKIIFDLKTEELSQPVEVENGYSIFKTTDRRNVEKLKPFEEARSGIKDMMIPYLLRDRKDETESRKQKFCDSLLNQYVYAVDRENCGLFLRVYGRLRLPAQISTAFNDKESGYPLATFRNGKITIAELVHVMRNNTQKLRMDERVMFDGLRNVALRRIFSDRARQKQYRLDIHEDEILNQYQTSLMVRKAAQTLFNSIEIKKEDMLNYYETNKEEYRQPGTINVAEIRSLDQKAVSDLFEEIKKGNNFDSLYKKAQGIEGFKCRTTGLVSETNSDEVIRKAQTLKAGEVSQPFMNVNKEYVIIKVMERTKGNIIAYADVNDRVSQDYLNFKRQITFNEWIANLSVQYKVHIFSDRLKEMFDIKLK